MFLLDVREQLHRDRHQLGFGVPIRCRAVAVRRSEVPLAIDERIAQREVLHHAHQRVVNRRVAVRVILAEDVADDGRRLLVRTTGHESQVVHRVEDPPVHRLESVAHVGQRAGDDDAHRVVDERLFDFLVDEAREDPFALIWSRHDVGRCVSGIGRKRPSRGPPNLADWPPESIVNSIT